MFESPEILRFEVPLITDVDYLLFRVQYIVVILYLFIYIII